LLLARNLVLIDYVTQVISSYQANLLQSTAKLALQALYMLRQIRLSICLSITPWYCVKMKKCRRMQSSPSG